MSDRAVRVILAVVLAASGWAVSVEAQTQSVTTTYPFPGMTYIKRTDWLPSFQCPGCPRATPSPRIANMNIVLVDLTAPEIHFKFTPQGTNLPAVLPGSTTPNWPVVPFEVVRRTTLAFLNDSHAQAAINSHFFAPFPVPGGSTQGAYAYLIGLAASRGNVYSAFEAPIQSYAIVTDSPGLNIDASNNASIVHRDPAFADGLHVIEDVQLWNTVSGSGQSLTNGVKTIPEYKDADHPDALLTPGPVPPLGGLPLTYTRAGRHWYDLSNARTAIGLTQDNKTLVLFTVDGTNGGNGMQVGEVADLLKNDYGVWNALNLDGGGSTTMAMENPVTHVRAVVNQQPGSSFRADASNLAVYSDGVDPVTTAVVTPGPNAYGWNNTSVTVDLNATDLASGYFDTPVGWVDQLQYDLAGAQPGDPQVVPGHSTSFGISPQGITTVTYYATDAAGNEETHNTLPVKIDWTAPVINGMPAGGCSLWPPNHKLQQVAVVSAADALSGVAPDSLHVTVTSNEPSDPSDPDAVVTPDGSGGLVVRLLAERLGGGSGRTYTLTATAMDRADNVKTMTATCVVPHDQRKK